MTKKNKKQQKPPTARQMMTAFQTLGRMDDQNLEAFAFMSQFMIRDRRNARMKELEKAIDQVQKKVKRLEEMRNETKQTFGQSRRVV